MKLLAILLLLSGCAPEIEQPQPLPSPSPSGEPGRVAPAPSPSPTSTPEKVSFEGYHTLPNGGYADIVEDAQGLYTIRSLRIAIKNADGTWGVLPLASTSPLAAVNGVIYLTQALTYIPATHNVRDSTNAPLNGSYSSQLRFLKSGGILAVITIITSSNNVLVDYRQ